MTARKAMDNAGDDRRSPGIGGFPGRSRNSGLSSSFFRGTIHQFHERRLGIARQRITIVGTRAPYCSEQ